MAKSNSASSPALRVAALLVVLLSAGGAAAAGRGLQQAADPATEPSTDPATSGALGFEWFLASDNATGITSDLAANGTNATIFAPSDVALQELATALGVPTPQDIFANSTLANATEATMALHIVPGATVYRANVTEGVPMEVTAADGTPLTITKDSAGTVFVTVGNDTNTTAGVTFPDVPYNGSIVHIINKVLLPAGFLSSLGL